MSDLDKASYSSFQQTVTHYLIATLDLNIFCSQDHHSSGISQTHPVSCLNILVAARQNLVLCPQQMLSLDYLRTWRPTAPGDQLSRIIHHIVLITIGERCRDHNLDNAVLMSAAGATVL